MLNAEAFHYAVPSPCKTKVLFWSNDRCDAVIEPLQYSGFAHVKIGNCADVVWSMDGASLVIMERSIHCVCIQQLPNSMSGLPKPYKGLTVRWKSNTKTHPLLQKHGFSSTSNFRQVIIDETEFQAGLIRWNDCVKTWSWFPQQSMLAVMFRNGDVVVYRASGQVVAQSTNCFMDGCVFINESSLALLSRGSSHCKPVLKVLKLSMG